MSVSKITWYQTVLPSCVKWLILSLVIFAGITVSAQSPLQGNNEIITDKQAILNGRIWRNNYQKAFGHQFFMTDNYITGSVTINGIKFSGLEMKWDIAGDELLLRIDPNPVIMLNKEMVDSFTLFFEGTGYLVINYPADTSGILKGYVNLLYKGPSSLYVKYIKKIQPLAVDGRYDQFYQENAVWIKKDSNLLAVSGKRELLSILRDKKKEIRQFLKSSRNRITVKDPMSMVSVLKYYDGLKKQQGRED